MLNKILFEICNRRNKEGFIEARPHTELVYKFACWLYKHGIIE